MLIYEGQKTTDSKKKKKRGPWVNLRLQQCLTNGCQFDLEVLNKCNLSPLHKMLQESHDIINQSNKIMLIINRMIYSYPVDA